MTKVLAGITTSLDGYITGPDDGPDKGLGEGGERLHYWVFGGPWTYEDEHYGEPVGADKQYLDGMTERVGAVIGGRGTFDAAEAWAAATRGRGAREGRVRVAQLHQGEHEDLPRLGLPGGRRESAVGAARGGRAHGSQGLAEGRLACGRE